MSIIINRFPNVLLQDFPKRRGFGFGCTLKTRFDSLPENKEILLELLIKEFLYQKDYWESDDAWERRALKYMIRRTKTIKYEEGMGLISMFVSTLSKKGKTITNTIEENIDFPEFMDSPANVDFNQDYFMDSGTIIREDNYYDLVTEGIPCKCVFSIEHKNRSEEPTIQCGHCHGSGVEKCPDCNGTGRASYEDGNYASGEIRMKTGRCPECGGTGRVRCPECFGKGVVEIFAPHYSLIRSVEEIISKHVDAFGLLPGEYIRRIVESPDKLEHKEFESNIDGMIERSFVTQAHNVLNLVNKEGQLSFLKKNLKDYLEDNRKEISDVFEELGLGETYKSVLKEVEDGISEIKRERGDIVGRQEVHYLFPIKVLRVISYDNDETKFIVYEKNGKVETYIENLTGISAGEALKIKIQSLFKTTKSLSL